MEFNRQVKNTCDSFWNFHTIFGRMHNCVGKIILVFYLLIDNQFRYISNQLKVFVTTLNNGQCLINFIFTCHIW